MPCAGAWITCSAARSCARRSSAGRWTTSAWPRSRTPTTSSPLSTTAFSCERYCLARGVAIQSPRSGMSTWLVALVLLPIALVLVAGLVVLLARPLALPALAALERARFQRRLTHAARGDAHLQERQRARDARRGARADRRPPAPLRAQGRLPVTPSGMAEVTCFFSCHPMGPVL